MSGQKREFFNYFVIYTFLWNSSSSLELFTKFSRWPFPATNLLCSVRKEKKNFFLTLLERSSWFFSCFCFPWLIENNSGFRFKNILFFQNYYNIICFSRQTWVCFIYVSLFVTFFVYINNIYTSDIFTENKTIRISISL